MCVMDFGHNQWFTMKMAVKTVQCACVVCMCTVSQKNAPTLKWYSSKL